MKREDIRRISQLRKTLNGSWYAPSQIEELVKSWMGYSLNVSIGNKISDVINKDGFAAKKIEFFEIPSSEKTKETRFIITSYIAETEEFTFSSIGLAEKVARCSKKFQALVDDFSKNGTLPKSDGFAYQIPNINKIYRVLVWDGYILAAWDVKHNKIYVSTKANQRAKESARLLKEFAAFVQSCLNGCNETAVLEYARFEY